MQTILEAVSHYELNDSGKFPDDCGDPTVPGQPSCNSASADPNEPNDYFLRFVVNKLTFYGDDDQVRLSNFPVNSPGQFTANVNIVIVHNHLRCTAGGHSTSNGAGYNDVVALYAIDTGGGATGGTPQCQQL